MNQVAVEEQGQERIQYLTASIGDRFFGIDAKYIQDIITNLPITKIPLAPPQIVGSLNLRGRIVTVIDARSRLGIPKDEEQSPSMHIIVDYQNYLYSLLVDNVHEVLSLEVDELERNPGSMDSEWKGISNGVYKLEKNLLVVIDVKRFLVFN
jgi:purine-binding chemotaxis protein CheW